MPKPASSTFRALACLFCLAWTHAALAQQETGPNLIAPPGASDLESGGLDLHGPAAEAPPTSDTPPATESPAPKIEQMPATAPVPPSAAPALEADSLTPPELQQPAAAASASPPPAPSPAATVKEGPTRSHVSAEIAPPTSDSTTGNPTAISSVEQRLDADSSAQKETNSLLVYLGIFVGGMVLLLLVLVLVLSQQNRRGRRRKRRRKADLPLKQRMAVNPQHLIKERDASSGHVNENAITPPSRFGGGPRRVTSRNGSPATAPSAIGANKPGTATPDAREEYSTLFEHMLRMNRLRQGEPDAPLDRMTLAELHLHFNALLRIIPTDAREPLVESIEIILDELEGRGDIRGD